MIRPRPIQQGAVGMIVRISGEDQYRLDDGSPRPPRTTRRRRAGGGRRRRRGRFQASLAELLDFVRANGSLSDEEIETSDVILPPSDITLAEAGAEFTGEGLIPD